MAQWLEYLFRDIILSQSLRCRCPSGYHELMPALWDGEGGEGRGRWEKMVRRCGGDLSSNLSGD